MRSCRRAVVVLLLSIAIASGGPGYGQSNNMYEVFVDGVRVSGYPLLRDGVAYLPANTLATALGVSITWNPQLNVVKLNNRLVSAQPLNEDGRLYLPVEAMVASLGGTVEWDGRNHKIRVHSQPDMATASGPAPPQQAPAKRTPAPVQRTPAPPRRATPAPAQPAYPPPPQPAYAPAQPAYTQPAYTQPAYTQPAYPSVQPVPEYSPPPSSWATPEVVPQPPMPVIVPAPPAPVMVTPDPPQVVAPTPTAAPPPPKPKPASNYNAYASTRPPPRSQPSLAMGGVYVPRSARNNVFEVTVTNVESVTSIKDYYRPRSGSRFVIVYLSQQNISEELQTYTGKFNLIDDSNRPYEYLEGLSNFWLVILRPFGINFGYLVFEVPVDARPARLALFTLTQPPLALSL